MKGWIGNSCFYDFGQQGARGGFAMMIFGVLVLGLIVAILVLIVRRFSGTGSGGRDEEALAVLRRRYAAGEIDEAEFEERKRILKR